MQDNANYSYISTIITPDGNTHYIKDAEGRTAITNLESSKQDKITTTNKLPASNISGLATVATSGSYNDLTNKPNIPEAAIVDSAMSSTSEHAVQNKVIKSYVDSQISGLGSILNYKGTKTSEAQIKAIASAKIGDVWINTADNSEWVCKQTITAATASAWEKLGPTIDLSGYAKTADLGSLAYFSSTTSSGTITMDPYTPEGSISINSYTPAGSITMNNYTPAGTISSGSGTANYTPAGSVTINSITPAGTISVGTGTANYTPAGTITMNNYTPQGDVTISGKKNELEIDVGVTDVYFHKGQDTTTKIYQFDIPKSISAPTITVTPNTSTVNSITAVGTLPSFSASVESETLSFSFDAGTLPTKGSNTTVVTSIKSASSTAPTFTNDTYSLSNESMQYNLPVSFTGTSAKPTGTFTGTGAELKFTGTSVTPTGSFTGTGTNLKFTGTSAKPSGSFSGTAATITGTFTGTAKAPTGKFEGDEIHYVKPQETEEQIGW